MDLWQSSTLEHLLPQEYKNIANYTSVNKDGSDPSTSIWSTILSTVIQYEKILVTQVKKKKYIRQEQKNPTIHSIERSINITPVFVLRV